MKVSIIIPVYNASAFLEKSIKSILNQTYKNIEILVCDDASLDQSSTIILELAKGDNRIKFLQNKSNLGYLKTINFLASKASGDFIAFQDADDFSHSQRIKLQSEFLINNKQVGLVGTNFSVIDINDNVLVQHNVLSDQDEIRDELQKSNAFQKPSIMFRKEILLTVGMFRLGFLKLGNISEDFDWILRVSEKYEVANINFEESLYSYRSVPTAMTKNFNKIEQLLGHDVAFFLAKERRNNGSDSLDTENFDIIDNYIKSVSLPYFLDKSLFYHKKASYFIYSGLYKQAIKEAFQAVKIEPFKIKNFKLMQYCIRKFLFRR